MQKRMIFNKCRGWVRQQISSGSILLLNLWHESTRMAVSHFYSKFWASLSTVTGLGGLPQFLSAFVSRLSLVDKNNIRIGSTFLLISMVDKPKKIGMSLVCHMFFWWFWMSLLLVGFWSNKDTLKDSLDEKLQDEARKVVTSCQMIV